MTAWAPAPICHIRNDTVASCSLTGRCGPAGELRDDVAGCCHGAVAPAIYSDGFVTKGSFSVAAIR